MSSDSERSSVEQSHSEETDPEEEIENDDVDVEVVLSLVQPYEDEPLADASVEPDMEEENEDADADGLTPTVLEARYERTVPVSSWCQCEQCNDMNLVGALEFRCCREVVHSSGKLVFDGSIERISCITQHEDYAALSNRTVLLQVAPLLRNKDGRSYRRRSGVPENEFIRAVAYRWMIRWLCGYMGWENTRPLPACIYHDIRSRYQTSQSRGYKNALPE